MDQVRDDRALAEDARGCIAVRHARGLAGWVGTGRPVTGKGVLRRADAAAAAHCVGIDTPKKFRSSADVPGLQHPWTAALAMGLLTISGGHAVPGTALGTWDAARDHDVLDGWSRGLAETLAATFDDDAAAAVEIGRLVLTVLAADSPATGPDLVRTISMALFGSSIALYRTFDRGFGHRDPGDVVLDLLAAYGAVACTDGRWRITPLGRWARGTLGPACPAPELVGGTCQLKITLRSVRPTCWRRILVPAVATLGDLHEIIQTAFSWDDDHLHAFTVGRRRYGDPYFDFDDDEDAVTIGQVFARARKPISYTYDFGESWEHEIALEATVEPDPLVVLPVCVDGRGDAPVEDCNDEPAWILFNQADVNARLARLVKR